MTDRVNLIVGFDQREAIAYHVFCQSVIEKASLPVQFLPLNPRNLVGYTERHKDGSNVFIYTRFLTPYLMDYKGWAIFADGDMVCNADIAELWRLRDPSKVVMVVKLAKKMTVTHLVLLEKAAPKITPLKKMKSLMNGQTMLVRKEQIQHLSKILNL